MFGTLLTVTGGYGENVLLLYCLSPLLLDLINITIPIHITVRNSIAMMLFTATVLPSRCMPTSDRKTKPWQARTIRESIPAQPRSLHRP
jgi:hypothetical protein